MKIGVIFDAYKGGGGGYFQSICTSKLLDKLNNEKNEIKFISILPNSDAELNENNIETIKFSKQKLSKLFYILSKSKILSFLFSKVGIENPFSKFLKKYNFDLIFFLGPSNYINFLNDINFIVNLYDLNFKFNNFFPEYKNEKIFYQTKDLVEKTVDRAFKILVDSNRTKNELINYFGCQSDKVEIYPFSTHIEDLWKKIENNFDLKNNLKNLKVNHDQKYFFYPAQFWSHKNHVYIIEAIEKLKKKEKINFKIVFSGNNKGNLNFIKKMIRFKKLDDIFIIFDYLTNEEIITLYKNSLGLIMPTYVARSTLPLYEAFYFKIPVFYSKDILDEKLEEFVFTFDLNNPENLAELLSNYKNLNIDEKISKANEYYLKFCSQKNKKDILETVISQYYYLSRRWK